MQGLLKEKIEQDNKLKAKLEDILKSSPEDYSYVFENTNGNILITLMLKNLVGSSFINDIEYKYKRVLNYITGLVLLTMIKFRITKYITWVRFR